MKYSLSFLLAVGAVSAQTALLEPYAQCGGLDYPYSWECEPGTTCTAIEPDENAFPNYQCLPDVGPIIAHVFPFNQCGGQGYTGATLCPPGWTCTVDNTYFSTCVADNGTVVYPPDPTPDLANPGNFCGESAVERDQASVCVPGYTCSGPGVYGYYVCLLGTSAASTTAAASTTIVTTILSITTTSSTSRVSTTLATSTTSFTTITSLATSKVSSTSTKSSTRTRHT